MDIIDEQKVGTAVAQRAVDKLFAASEKAAAKWNAKHKNKTLKSFANYLISRFRRARQVRNLIYDSSSGDLHDLYVDARLSRGHQVMTDKEFVELVARESLKQDLKASPIRPTVATIIRGSAGTGKSMLMKWIFLRLYEKQARVPILIELRDFNDAPPQDMLDLIQQEFGAYDSDISREQIELGLQNGLFAVLLDGLDEIDPQLETFWHKGITALAKRFPLTPIVVSGRPTSEMLAWTEFKLFDVEPLLPDDVERLITKLEFDDEVKLSFIDECRSRLFESHEEFLKNPLLVTVMLLTHSDNGRISSETHEFYDDAFNALWNRHDARKEGFQRRRYCELPKHKFLSLLSAFSASSYIRNTFSFRDPDFDKHLKIAMRITDIDVDGEKFRKDLLKSTSLCVVEGAFLRFSHRTFQEYFCALYILKQEPARAREALLQASARFKTDNVLAIVHSLDAEKFERNFVLPVVRQFLAGSQEYSAYPRDHSISAIRHFYQMKPTTESVTAALDAWRDIREMSGDEALPPQLTKLLRKDAQNFRALEHQLAENAAERERARNSLFGDEN